MFSLKNIFHVVMYWRIKFTGGMWFAHCWPSAAFVKWWTTLVTIMAGLHCDAVASAHTCNKRISVCAFICLWELRVGLCWRWWGADKDDQWWGPTTSENISWVCVWNMLLIADVMLVAVDLLRKIHMCENFYISTERLKNGSYGRPM